MSGRTPLLFVRHGQTPWNLAGIWQGQADPGLTDTGHEQAREVAATLAAESERPWRRILASDLARARLTAEAIAASLDLEIVLDPRLRERDVGHWSGRKSVEIEREEPEQYASFRSGDPQVRPGGGENTLDVRARALAVVREWAETRPGEAVILVTHLGLIRSLVPDCPSENGGRTAVLAEALLEANAPARATAGVRL